MVLLRCHVHPRGLSLAQQRKVYIRRTVHKEPWETIALKVKNLKGQTPYWQVCRDAFKRMLRDAKQDAYANCGREALITPALRRWLVSRLVALRKVTVCTSQVLQRELAREKGVIVEASTVRRHLGLAGYKWMRRSTKRKYSPQQKAERMAFAQKVVDMTPAQLDAALHFTMDGVVLEIPPQDIIARENFLRSDDTYVWRKPSEKMLPELAGHDRYRKQVPRTRMLPFWGGIGHAGFAMVLQHDNRKVTSEEWVEALETGCLLRALKSTNPGRTRGPWAILCDNESFLRTPDSLAALRRDKIKFWKLPAKSPDLNPIEKYWAWIRKRMRAMDLADLAAKRPALGKTAYKARLMRLVKTAEAKAIAGRTFRNLRKACQEVLKSGGGASSG